MSAKRDLSVRGLAAGYGGTPVISDVSLDVPTGEITLVIGPNGSGKSTLAKALAGVIPKMAGSVLLGDEDLTRVRSDQLVRRGVGYVPQVRDVFDPLTVSENLQVSGYTLDKQTFAARRSEVFTVFPRLAELRRRLAVNLSGGERKMLGIARVLMLAPSIVIIDEPTAGLSPRLSQEVLHDHVVRIASAGAGVLLIEQRAADALKIAHTACVMSGGRLRLKTSAEDPARHEDIVAAMLGDHAP
ncbi:MAG: branched-chain amino acid transport system ATP-binding protein [Solirubrobacteraceae bacterium]|jgi:ABC-type branched-subunit amino acid transport system ATPase component|nr:branched-chain amino acid transport system ATP-binding protein [Solirubrobacteraceae bacterium]